MVLVLIGASYSEMPLHQLEILEREASTIRQQFDSGVLVSTCNRFEVYLECQDQEISALTDRTLSLVDKATGLGLAYLSSVLKVSYGSAVVQHLYSVASGLDSMVIGEAEIAGQVRRSLQLAQESQQATTELNTLFQSAASVAKRVITETGLGEAGRSIIATALQLHEDRFGSLAGASAVLFGTGAYARVAVAALQRLGVEQIQVYSESGRAEEFCSNRQTTPVARGTLRQALAQADLIVTASGSRSYSISFHLAKDALQMQRDLGIEPGLRIVDVALAKSVAPHAYELPEVQVIDLDYVQQHAPRRHTESVKAAREIVLAAVADFEQDQQTRVVDPMISVLRQHLAGWVEEEVARVRSRAGDQTAEEVARSLRRVANAILHTPSVNAKELAKAGNHEEYAKALKTLFDIELSRND